MLKKYSQSSASGNDRNVHNGSAFLQIIIFWTKYCTINVHTYFTLKHILILKNIKHLKVLETNQKRAETDRESILGIKEHHWINFLFLQLFAWGQSLIGTAWGSLELRKKFPVLLALEIRKERLRHQLKSEGKFTEEETQIMHANICQIFDFWTKHQHSLKEHNRIHSLQSIIHKVQDVIQNSHTYEETGKFDAFSRKGNLWTLFLG